MKTAITLISVLYLLLLTSCRTNSSGWPIIWFMHNGVPVQKQQQPVHQSSESVRYPAVAALNQHYQSEANKQRRAELLGQLRDTRTNYPPYKPPTQ